ncbi:MAG: hypothetical protein ACI9G1_005531 [Pirellulaceae bacterium]|jgi:hypothetical protein
MIDSILPKPQKPVRQKFVEQEALIRSCLGAP